MNPMKRLGLVALLVALAAVVAGSPALAGKNALRGVSPTKYKLAPPVDAPEPRASGTWTLEESWDLYKTEHVTVSCTRLTPGQQYTVVVLVDWYSWSLWGDASGSDPVGLLVTADANGRLNAEDWEYSAWHWHGGYEGGWSSGIYRHVAAVWILNAACEVVLESR